MSVVRAACPVCGNDTSLFLPKPETKWRSPACSSSSPTNDLSYLQPNLISYNLAVAIVSFWILATLLCTVPVWKPSRLSEIVYTAQTCVVSRALLWQPTRRHAAHRELHNKKFIDIRSENNQQKSQHVNQTTKYPFETITSSSLHIRLNAKTIQVEQGRRHLSQVYLLEEVSLAGAGLRHLPAGWQGHVVGNLVRRLTHVLRGGARRPHAWQGASRNGPQLQGGWGGVRTDVVRRESAAAPSISAGLNDKKQNRTMTSSEKEPKINEKWMKMIL